MISVIIYAPVRMITISVAVFITHIVDGVLNKQTVQLVASSKFIERYLNKILNGLCKQICQTNTI